MVDRVDLRGDPDGDLSAVIDHLRSDGVIGYPTETVYGLGGACTARAASRVRAIKARDGDKPLLVLARSREDLEGLEWTPVAEELADMFWPGSVTLVLRDPRGLFPAGVGDAATGTVGVRISPHPVVGRLVDELGGPILSTSLNLSGEPPAASGHEALEILERLGVEDVVLVDGGTLPHSEPSTVVDCTGAEAVVLRAGAIPAGRLRCVVPEIHG